MDHPAPGGPGGTGVVPFDPLLQGLRSVKGASPWALTTVLQHRSSPPGSRVPKLATTPVGVVSTHSGSGQDHPYQRQPARLEARSSPASASPPPGLRLPWRSRHRQWMTQAMDEVCI